MTDSLALICEWCGRPLPPRGTRGPRAHYCRPSCRQRAYEARLFAKVAAAGPGLPEQRPDAATLSELADRLLQLSQAQEAARATVSLDEPDYAQAFERLFVAVALLNPLHAAERIRKMLPPPR